MKYICDKDSCTFCQACINVCRHDAITIRTDLYGYEYMCIDEEKCTHCGACKNVCAGREKVKCSKPIVCYAVQMKDYKKILHSASGGFIQVIAKEVIQSGGVAYGAAMIKENGKFMVIHQRVDSVEQIKDILGSKYLPSYMHQSYIQAKEDLKAGKTVLFTGTPCQIQGLKAYLGVDSYENLITADLICHGVPNTQMFRDYIRDIESRCKIKIKEYCFRDKKVSWGMNYRMQYSVGSRNRLFIRHCPREESSYMAQYLQKNIFREKCYSCDFANIKRGSDFTCGDFWGIEKAIAEGERGLSTFRLKKGVSCILVNTEKGVSWMEKLSSELKILKVPLESIVRNQPSLRGHRKNENREKILSLYAEKGWAEIDKNYRVSMERKIMIYRLKNKVKRILPNPLRVYLYNHILGG